jgi:DNA invertase Pin-like site-specific DNA recombinase
MASTGNSSEVQRIPRHPSSSLKNDSMTCSYNMQRGCTNCSFRLVQAAWVPSRTSRSRRSSSTGQSLIRRRTKTGAALTALCHTLREGIDTSTPAGRLVAGVLESIAEFERARIQERIHAGLARARSQGKRLGRRRSPAARRQDSYHGLSHAAAAAQLGVSTATVKRWRRTARQPVPTTFQEIPDSTLMVTGLVKLRH